MVVTGSLHRYPSSVAHLLRHRIRPETGDNAGALAAQFINHVTDQSPTSSWNTILRSYCLTQHDGDDGDPAVPIHLYCCMLRLGTAPDAHTFRFLFRACARRDLSMHREGEELHAAGHSRGLIGSDSLVGSSLIHMYAELGLMGNARMVFDEMDVKGELLWTTMVAGYAKNGCMVEAQKLFDKAPVKNTVSWTSIIAGYSRSGQPAHAVRNFEMMISGSVIPDSVTFVSVLPACAQARNLELGKWVHRVVIMEGVTVTRNLAVALVDMYSKCGDMDSARHVFDAVGWKIREAWNAIVDGYCKLGDLQTARSLFDQLKDRDCISFNSMITGYVQNCRLKEALLLFAELRESGLEPDTFTMAGLLTACANLSALNQGKALHALIVVSNCIKIDVFLGTALLDMYAKCGRIDQSILVFNRMVKKDLQTWTAIISGFAMHGKGRLALEYFSSMCIEGLQPNSVAYIGVLNGCSHSGLMDEGKMHFKEMQSLHNIKPEIEHYGCMVDLLGRCGFLKEAEELIHNMPMEPNAVIWNSLLSACRMHKAVDIAEKAAKNSLALEPNEDGVYVQLYNIYISSGRWADASEIRGVMERRAIRKIAGCSSIIVGGQVHKFSAGDRSHPEIMKIRRMLREIAEKLNLAGYAPSTSSITEFMDGEEKDHHYFDHSERIAVAYGMIKLGRNLPIHVLKNLRICEDCHSAIKLIAKIWNREIVVRDRSRFHHFIDGKCSCSDFW